MDLLSPEQRSKNMSRILSKDTRPELIVRSIVYKLGFRYRLHVKEVPGKPDLVFKKRKKAIFVHGCFWHQHPGCREGRVPGSRTDYWQPKLRRNQERDIAAQTSLKCQGWQFLIIWECELKNLSTVVKRIKQFLEMAA